MGSSEGSGGVATTLGTGLLVIAHAILVITCWYSMMVLTTCYVPYHRSNSVSVSAWDALQTHCWSPNISEIIITLSFGTSLVNGLCPTHVSYLASWITVTHGADTIWFNLSHHTYIHFTICLFHITMRFLYLIFLFSMCSLPYYKPLCFSFYYLNIKYLSCHSQFRIST